MRHGHQAIQLREDRVNCRVTVRRLLQVSAKGVLNLDSVGRDCGVVRGRYGPANLDVLVAQFRHRSGRLVWLSRGDDRKGGTEGTPAMDVPCSHSEFKRLPSHYSTRSISSVRSRVGALLSLDVAPTGGALLLHLDVVGKDWSSASSSRTSCKLSPCCGYVGSARACWNVSQVSWSIRLSLHLSHRLGVHLRNQAPAISVVR